jgi:hypothetical protein
MSLVIPSGGRNSTRGPVRSIEVPHEIDDNAMMMMMMIIIVIITTTITVTQRQT